jgi:hypothetical protein
MAPRPDCDRTESGLTFPQFRFKGEKNVLRHNPTDPSGSSFGGRAPRVAVQRQLGLLPERRIGFGSHRAADLGRHRTTVGQEPPRMSLGTRKISLPRIFIALSAVVFASCLAAAADDAANSRACTDLGGPSNFDYLVLASIADSPHLLAMAGYRSTARPRAETLPGSAVDCSTNEGTPQCRL